MNKICGLGVVLLGLAITSCSSVKNDQLTQATFEVCLKQKGQEICKEIVSPVLYWGEVKDVKIIKDSLYSIPFVKSRGCVGWRKDPDKEDYYYDPLAFESVNLFAQPDAKIKLIKTEPIPDSQREEMIKLQNEQATNSILRRMPMAGCTSEKMAQALIDYRNKN